jgi:hypothetical protein
MCIHVTLYTNCNNIFSKTCCVRHPFRAYYSLPTAQWGWQIVDFILEPNEAIFSVIM